MRNTLRFTKPSMSALAWRTSGLSLGIKDYSRSTRREEMGLGFGKARSRRGPYSSRRRRSPTWKRSFPISIRPPLETSASRGKLPVAIVLLRTPCRPPSRSLLGGAHDKDEVVDHGQQREFLFRCHRGLRESLQALLHVATAFLALACSQFQSALAQELPTLCRKGFLRSSRPLSS